MSLKIEDSSASEKLFSALLTKVYEKGTREDEVDLKALIVEIESDLRKMLVNS